MTVATVGMDQKLYVLANDGVRLGPAGNIAATRRMFDTWSADIVVVEKNHGGRYLPQMLRDAGLPVQVVNASQGKRTRAEPVAKLYSPAGLGWVTGVVHCDVFDDLEDQLTTWDGAPGQESPDRMDSLVWALTALAGDALTAALSAPRTHDDDSRPSRRDVLLVPAMDNEPDLMSTPW